MGSPRFLYNRKRGLGTGGCLRKGNRFMLKTIQITIDNREDCRGGNSPVRLYELRNRRVLATFPRLLSYYARIDRYEILARGAIRSVYDIHFLPPCSFMISLYRALASHSRRVLNCAFSMTFGFRVPSSTICIFYTPFLLGTAQSGGVPVLSFLLLRSMEGKYFQAPG